MSGKETSLNKPVPLGKNWRVNFSCCNRAASIFAFLVDAKVEAQYKNNLSVH